MLPPASNVSGATRRWWEPVKSAIDAAYAVKGL
jgi:hypothetical protein